MDDDRDFARHQLSKAARWLLQHTVDDLARRSESKDEYEQLGAAAVLRRTLLEDHLLKNTAAPKSIRLDFEFTPNEEIRPPEASFTQIVYLLDAGTFRVPSVHGNERDLLQASLGSIGGESLTVRQFIKHFANVEGGVHLGGPRTDQSQALRDVFFFRSGAWRHGLALLCDVAAVTARGLEPLIASAPSEARI